ncbi:MAG: SDR family oxidoreductase [Myxococcales bacterium]|nr:SDR family oxidoreductase [Myxococcales bacterium]
MKTALVTGASRGLGEALVDALVARGVRVAGVARDAVALERIRARHGAAFVPIAADVGEPGAAARVAGAALGALGSLDLLVHNASALGPVPLRPLLEVGEDDLLDVLRTNLVGPHALTLRLVGAMALRGAGTVVGISSDAAVEHYPGWGVYGASKAAQDHLFGTLAAEQPDLRFITVDPGEMDTTMHADAIPEADPATLRRPADVARALLDHLDVAGSGRAALEVA